MRTKFQRVRQIPVEAIRPNPAQPRRYFDPAALEELADSIRACGILQPLTVRRAEGGWELVAGERRLRAARLAGLSAVPCLERSADPDEQALLALVENLQRRDLHFFEEAEALAAYLRASGLSQEAAAGKLGKSPSALANKLRLLHLSPACRKALTEGGLSERHARCLLRLTDESDRLAVLGKILEGRLSVAQAEALVEQRLEALQSTPPARRKTFILKDVRLFLNSLDRGLRLIRSAGVDADCRREETDEEILLTLRIPKNRPKELP